MITLQNTETRRRQAHQASGLFWTLHRLERCAAIDFNTETGELVLRATKRESTHDDPESPTDALGWGTTPDPFSPAWVRLLETRDGKLSHL